ncbi:MAG: tetratricopeptide repeat protein [Gemmataceae bacterium]|nr:tetratricopeptide repeat protein [Gemmataceae bacterium]
MSSLQDRIVQFRKMASDDADNELGHFRLGQLLTEAGDHAAAVTSFERTLEISPGFSKVFQLLGVSQLKLGRKDEAVATWLKGWKVADERGDKMPRDEMAKLMRENGATPPEPAKAQVEDGPETGFRCTRPGCLAGKRAKQLAAPPIQDEVHQRICREICADCWNDWFKNQSVKVINELRLDLSSDFGQEEYDKYMFEFLGFEVPAKA